MGGEPASGLRSERERRPTATAVDLSGVEGTGGVVWSVSPGGFHANLVVLDSGGSIEPHRNDAFDVLVVVMAGSGTVTVDGVTIDLTPTVALLIPRGASRSVTAGEQLRYLTIHAQRGQLGITPKVPAEVST